MNILVTGASGFVGNLLIARLARLTNFNIVAALRNDLWDFPAGVSALRIDEIGKETCWNSGLIDTDTVIHAAARAHIINDDITDPLTEYRRVNVEGTLNLARQAASAGVKRFIFISSIKVNGELTQAGSCFTENDPPGPQDAYGISKCEAEEGIRQISEETGMDVVIIRPPLVYGPGVKGNFRNMMRWLQMGIPLPLGAVHNRRSLVGVDNLVDLIITCIEHPAAANQTFLVADGEDLSTSELLRRLAKFMKVPVRLISVPVPILELAADIFCKKAISQRLCGNLQVDISKARSVLGWEPPSSVDDGLKRCADGMTGSSASGGSEIIRVLDIFFSSLGLFLGSPILLVLLILGLFDTGSPIFRQQRVGRKQQPFTLVKFRTMKLDTESVATHFASAASITKLGHLLRKTKLDEVPQLWNVLKGEMSLVGPRPCLFNQEELIQERAKRGVFDVRPGITGLAQVKKIDMSTPKLLAETDAQMINKLTLRSYFSYVAQTVMGRGTGDRVVKD